MREFVVIVFFCNGNVGILGGLERRMAIFEGVVTRVIDAMSVFRVNSHLLYY